MTGKLVLDWSHRLLPRGFVGTLATIYSVGSASEGENIDTIKTKMANETYADGTKVFTLASGISLLFSMPLLCNA